MQYNIFIFCILVVLPMTLCQEEKATDYTNYEDSLHVRNYNQTCDHEGQCSDFRLICVEKSSNEKRCLCSKFYRWDRYSQQCLAENVTEMLSQLNEQYDAQAEETEEAHKIFSGMLIAGFMVLGVGIVMATVCTVIACYRPSSKELSLNSENMDRRRRSSAAGSRSAGPRAVSPRRDGTVDYVPGLFDVSGV